jgi:hypothetical protein
MAIPRIDEVTDGTSRNQGDASTQRTSRRPAHKPRDISIRGIIFLGLASTIFAGLVYGLGYKNGGVAVTQHAIVDRTVMTYTIPVRSDYVGPGYVFVDVPEGSTVDQSRQTFNRVAEKRVGPKGARRANPGVNLNHVPAGASVKLPARVAVANNTNAMLKVTTYETVRIPKFDFSLSSFFNTPLEDEGASENDADEDWKYETHVWD